MMVTKVEAYTCDRTGRLYESEGEAVRAEFKAMLREVAESMPAMGTTEANDIMVWLAQVIHGEMYPTVLPKLIAALEYYREHRIGRG